MIDRSRVCAKLAQLRERQDLLRQLAGVPREQFVADPVRRSAAERGLQVSIEICLDIGHHLISALGLPRPTEYRDVFHILGERGVVSTDVAARLVSRCDTGAAGHQYRCYRRAKPRWLVAQNA